MSLQRSAQPSLRGISTSRRSTVTVVPNTKRLSYPSHLRWRCIRCTNSCRDLPGRKRNILLTRSDTERIAAATKRKPQEFSLASRGHFPYERTMRKRGRRCIFLQCKSCSIYRARPLICRFYPFSLDSSASGELRIDLDAACLGIGTGKTRDATFYRGLVRLARRELGQEENTCD